MTLSAPETHKYQPHIDGLRAIAVLVVLFFHLGISQFGGGFVGVDVFFVISGFLITGLLKNELDKTGSIQLGTFYKRRIRRLFPALLMTLALTTVAAVLLFSPSVLMRFGTSLTYAVAGLSNFVFWFEADYFDLSAQLKPLLHTWSLSVEEQFYLLWPSALLACYKLGLKRILPVLLIMVALASITLNAVFADGHVSFITTNFAFFEEYFANPKSTLYFLLPFRVFEFAIGGLLVWVVRFPRPRWLNADLLLWCGLAAIAYVVVTFDEKMLFPSYAGLVPCLATAAVIYAGGQAQTNVVLTNRVFVGIGKISYSLYLIHWPVIVFWLYVTKELTVQDQALITLVSIGAAYLSYRFVETPFRQASPQRGANGQALGALAGVLCVMTLGIYMHQSHGLPGRIESPGEVKLGKSAAEFHRDNYGGNGYPSYGAVGDSLTSPDIVLMGDSHGRHYAEGLIKEFAEPRDLNLHIAAGTSCFHLPGFTRVTNEAKWDRDCPNAYDYAIKTIINAKNPPLVVLSHSWVSQMGRADLMDADGQRLNASVDSKDLIAGLINLKKAIGDAQLLVIGNVPTTSGVDIYDHLTRPPLLAFLQAGDDLLASSPLASHIKGFNQTLKQAATDTGAFIFIDPSDALCLADRCMNIDLESQNLVYSDTSHLSKHGSRLMIRNFLPEFKALVSSGDYAPGKFQSSS